MSNDNVRQSLIQALLYVASFFVTYSPYGTTFFVNMKFDAVEKNRNIFFPLVALAKIFMPAQGVWNVLIYIRPRYHEVKRRHPDQSSIMLLRKIIFNAKLTSTAQVAVEQADNVEGQSEEIDFTPELNLTTHRRISNSSTVRVFPRQRELEEKDRRQSDSTEADKKGEPPASTCFTEETRDTSNEPSTASQSTDTFTA